MHYLFILIPILILLTALLLWGIFTKWDFIEKLTIRSLGNRICTHIFKRTYLNDKKVKLRLSKRGELYYLNSWYPSPWKNSKDYISYWKSDKVQKICQNYIKKNINTKFKTNHPIIHFRCSDVPFNKHPDYRLPKKQVLTLINKILKKKGYKKAIFLSCTDHGKNKCAEKACREYSDYYISLLDIDIEKQCNSQEKDFSLMYNSPFVISLVNSSFSMMAKLHDLDNYKTIYTVNKKINDEIPWAITGSDTISHKDIKNYCNTGKVIGKGIEHYKKKIIGTSFEDIPKDFKKKNEYVS